MGARNHTMSISRLSVARLLQTTALAFAVTLGTTDYAAADTSDPNWTPQASERLVKLPASYLKKSLDHDFAESELGLALEGVESDIGFKTQTLSDLQSAVGRSESEVRTELRHQFLAEKREFLDLISRKNELRQKHLATRQRVFEDMLDRLTDDAALSPARRELIEHQDAARTRFESSITDIDLRVFETTASPESRYATQYAVNMAAIEKLVDRIQGHPMSDSAQMDGIPMTKQEYLRHMLAGVQAEMAILEQDETLLGYMAKLIALDAMALSEESMDAELADSDLPGDMNVADATDYFLTN